LRPGERRFEAGWAEEEGDLVAVMGFGGEEFEGWLEVSVGDREPLLVR
jgi:hypothetical protein